MYDLLVKNGRIVTAQAVTEGNIGIKDGRIAALLEAGQEPEAAKVIDAKGKYVFPGAIDTMPTSMIRGMNGGRIMNMGQRRQPWEVIPPSSTCPFKMNRP